MRGLLSLDTVQLGVDTDRFQNGFEATLQAAGWAFGKLELSLERLD